MERKIGAEDAVTISGVTLIPVTKISLNCQRIGNSISCFGTKQPSSVVVISQTTRRAFNTTGEEVSLDQLVQDAPSIKKLIDGFQLL
ncbi:MAG: hypothetical protein FJ006_08185 [Chloroflexi bacterium]|nr:hypothetical protein [Chloroflexota bacterium]